MSRRALLLGFLSATIVLARDGLDFAAVRESLEHVPRKRWAWWLEDHGYDASRLTTYHRPESTGLRLVGKWGRGPSVEVTGRDTLVVLTLGSEVALLSFADPDSPRVLSEIQLDYLPRQSQLVDSLLFTGGSGIQIWNISDPTRPALRGVIPYAVGDFSVRDSLVFFVSLDTFFVYSAARPTAPTRVGFYLDSGYVASVTASAAVLLFRDFVGFVDISNPASPHRVGTFPGWALSAEARGNVCCAAFLNPNNQDECWLLTLDIANLAAPRQIGRLDSICGDDIFLTDSLAIVFGLNYVRDNFQVVSIQDSARPRLLGTCNLRFDGWGVWANPSAGHAYAANDAYGLVVIDIGDLRAPVQDTAILNADQALDVSVDGPYAYVADRLSGLHVLDLTNPASPVELGWLDPGIWASRSVAARDSFAFEGYSGPPYLRSVDVSDPRHPAAVGGGAVQTIPEDIVLRDSLVYVAGRLRFNVVNVARPRQPVLVGSCVTQDGVYFGLALQDTLAYIAGGPSLQVVNVADPVNPRVVGNGGQPSSGVAVRDTFAYIPYPYDTLFVYSTANPGQMRQLSATPTGVWPWDVALGDSELYVGEAYGINIYELSNPAMPQRVGGVSVPYGVRRLHYAGGLLYAALWEAGLAVYETTTVGITEREPALAPSHARVWAAPGLAGSRVTLFDAGQGMSVRVYDAAGRSVHVQVARRDGAKVELGTAELRSGVYFVELTGAARTDVLRIVKP